VNLLVATPVFCSDVHLSMDVEGGWVNQKETKSLRSWMRARCKGVATQVHNI
jgi:hypothetical protein